MNKFNIIAGILILVSIGIFFSLSRDVSSYATFAEATQRNQRVKVAGLLAKDKEMYYNPEENPNYFSFYLRDPKGQEKKVILLQGKPQDFDRSEQIVVTGEMKGDDFVANEVLLKCPSKYKDEEIYMKKQI
ncbi:MAG: cytochrome c maturation protein CcmE [Saprospiraceae bacterium]|jgi:cytochrome c-type biogenesis protein CcmE|nr:cytochrome c maturation protein CcmE [Saprospiraceae bacterium]MBK6477532.1 cytochrome c maturation protein CcmE [Saprospiraceae bacterium]MBK6816595.1 cytochrome c maturation protein CcmE [Saprospiraceae bacterium]MBK7371121.1 cytochrome c maturation protein CcmE [Saprospiraceae bacterium]MBK7436379.1 cytochrome c maturation protein CcmE [Saprospiraceae bacterium]